eukprot:9498651-Pyramimonas_sp.AAC.1
MLVGFGRLAGGEVGFGAAGVSWCSFGPHAGGLGRMRELRAFGYPGACGRRVCGSLDVQGHAGAEGVWMSRYGFPEVSEIDVDR